MVDLGEVAVGVAEVHLDLSARQLVDEREPSSLDERSRRLQPTVRLLEVVHLHTEMLRRSRRLVGREEVELEVTQPEPAHVEAEVRRRQPHHAEQLLPPAHGGFDVGSRNAHVVEPRSAHATRIIVR